VICSAACCLKGCNTLFCPGFQSFDEFTSHCNDPKLSGSGYKFVDPRGYINGFLGGFTGTGVDLGLDFQVGVVGEIGRGFPVEIQGFCGGFLREWREGAAKRDW
jgi:hypothetical protein